MKLGKKAYAGLGVVEEYRESGKTRAEFCRSRGLALSTLDYYVRRDRVQPRQRILPVRVADEVQPGRNGFTVVLRNGRRIELAGDFDEAGLARLIPMLERS